MPSVLVEHLLTLTESLWEASGRCLPCVKGEAERCNSQILGICREEITWQLFNNVISDVF